jgi:hypothetical protein
VRDELPPEAMAVVLCAFRDCRADLASVAKRIENDLITSAGKRRFTVEGLGEVEIRPRKKRTEWDNDGLTRKVVALALDERVLDETTGEYEPAHAAVARVLAECARPSWRLTPLRARHVPIDEYCHEEDDGWSVQLPARAS